MSNAKNFINLKRYQFHDGLVNHIRGIEDPELNIWRYNSRLGSILSLRNVELQWNMFEALVELWDPVEMTFKFRDTELTPSLEEFARITSLQIDSELIVPVTQDGYGSVASTFLGVTKDKLIDQGRPIVHDVGTSYLLDLINCDPNRLSTKQKMKRQNAFDLAVVGSFLFSNDKYRVDLRLCKVIEEMRTGNCTMVPLFLAEMLRSLNDCKNSSSGSSLTLRGPVAVLQIWVFEHFAEVFDMKNVTRDPGNNIIYDYCRKQRQAKLKSKQDWYCVLFFTKENEIVWRCPWFTPRPVLRIGPPTKTGFLLPCLTGYVAYNPIKVIRQLGFKRNIVTVDSPLPSHDYDRSKYSEKMAKRLKSEWKNTVRTAEEFSFVLEFSYEPPADEDWFDKYMATPRPTQRTGSTSR